MEVNKHTREDLKTMQSWPLEQKIRATMARIIEWYERIDGQVYVSFSGGKDSTIILDIARKIYPHIEAVFVDTGLEYPEIRDFVKTFDNVTWLHPIKYDRKTRKYVRTNFREVIDTYGYPVISKEQSFRIRKLRNQNLTDAYRQSQMKRLGLKWEKMLVAPFECSEQCCDSLKKRPISVFEKQTNKHPITGIMACESSLREYNWLKFGCNTFDKKRPISQPMSFWTEKDIVDYLKLTKIKYCKVYGEISNGEFTGEKRTGCVFCMFGCHLEKGLNRFQRMKITHPGLYDYCIKQVDKGGLGLGRVLDYIGVPY